MNTDGIEIEDYRIFHRVGPGDTFKVIQRRVPAKNFEDAASIIPSLSQAPSLVSGAFMVQHIVTGDARLYQTKMVTVEA